jgi:hypothetical protein
MENCRPYDHMIIHWAQCHSQSRANPFTNQHNSSFPELDPGITIRILVECGLELAQQFWISKQQAVRRILKLNKPGACREREPRLPSIVWSVPKLQHDVTKHDRRVSNHILLNTHTTKALISTKLSDDRGLSSGILQQLLKEALPNETPRATRIQCDPKPQATITDWDNTVETAPSGDNW